MGFHSRLGLGLWFLAIAGAPTLLGGQSPAPPSLGSADSFAVLGGSSVTSIGSTVVTGNLGVSPGNTISGSITVKVGATYRNDSVAKQAQNDAGAAYHVLANRMCDHFLTGPNLGNVTLEPGFYCFSTSSLVLTGRLILKPGTDPNAVWSFRIGSTLTTAPSSSVRVINNGYEGNIFWQVGDSATLSPGTTFVGNVLAHNDITLHASASVSGRLLAQGAVFLDGNNVTLCCGPIIVSPETLPKGTVCSPYTTTTFTASGGMAPYTFSVASDGFSVASDGVTYGPLPDGLTLVNGVLSGTPEKQGSFNILITATDSKGCTGARSYVIQIDCLPPGPPIPLQPVKACELHCQQIAPSCGIGHTFSVLPGALPAGLTLSSTGMLCGTPPAPGDYIFTITDETSGCPTRYSLHVVCNVVILPETLPGGAACVLACRPLTASCGTPPYTFSVSSATPSDGVTISPDGMLCETPTAPGPSTFTVTATDANGCTGSRTYTVPVACNVMISPATFPNGTVGTPYDQTITGSCGTGPYTCSLNDMLLPPGLTHTSCRISGTPTKAGCFPFTVTVTDANGCFRIISYTICIDDPCPITISPPTLPDANVCVFYSQPLTPSCATAPYICSLTEGMLPSGLALANCTISGIPTTPGPSMFTITVTDAVSKSGLRKYALTVTGGLTIAPPCPPGATPGVPYSEVLTASGGTAPYTFVLNGPLPPGLTFMQTTPTTATISGTPTTPGCFPITITVTDANGCSTSNTCTLCVAAGGPTLTGWGMVVLSILLVAAGLVMMRRGGIA
jgi:hypothetical protein